MFPKINSAKVLKQDLTAVATQKTFCQFDVMRYEYMLEFYLYQLLIMNEDASICVESVMETHYWKG